MRQVTGQRLSFTQRQLPRHEAANSAESTMSESRGGTPRTKRRQRRNHSSQSKPTETDGMQRWVMHSCFTAITRSSGPLVLGCVSSGCTLIHFSYNSSGLPPWVPFVGFFSAVAGVVGICISAICLMSSGGGSDIECFDRFWELAAAASTALFAAGVVAMVFMVPLAF